MLLCIYVNRHWSFNFFQAIWRTRICLEGQISLVPPLISPVHGSLLNRVTRLLVCHFRPISWSMFNQVSVIDISSCEWNIMKRRRTCGCNRWKLRPGQDIIGKKVGGRLWYYVNMKCSTSSFVKCKREGLNYE